MHRTFNTLRLFVAAIALVLAVLAAPAAHAQSVTGGGGVDRGGFGTVLSFTVDASTDKNGHAHGNIVLLLDSGNGSSTLQLTVESLSVTGNQATVWAREKNKSKTLHEFLFVDNGDGSIAPDTFTWDADLLWPMGRPSYPEMLP